jgi:hypothetical protein
MRGLREKTCSEQGGRSVSEAQRVRLLRDLEAARDAHRQITTQSQRLTQGKRLAQCKIVNAYDPTIAPIIKGKSNCPAQFGRKTGLLSEPASGSIFATRVPKGNPSDSSYVLPMLDKVQQAIDLVKPRQEIVSNYTHHAEAEAGASRLTAGLRLQSRRKAAPSAKLTWVLLRRT